MAARTVFFRYSADVRPFTWVLAAATLSVSPLILVHFRALSAWELTGFWMLSLYCRCRGPYSQHNHGHLPVFGARPLNFFYDTVLTLITGYPTALWELQHNLGHHRTFLETDEDVAGIIDPKTQRPYSRLWYTIRGNCLIHRDAFRIGRVEAARGKPRLLRKLELELVVQAIVMTSLLAINWELTVVFLVIPNILAGALVWWESYVHHLGVPATHMYDGSVTTVGRAFNQRNFNIGHHTAHHEKPTLHWSLLPMRTEVIAAKVPEVCWRGESPGAGGLIATADERGRALADTTIKTAGMAPST